MKSISILFFDNLVWITNSPGVVNIRSGYGTGAWRRIFQERDADEKHHV